MEMVINLGETEGIDFSLFPSQCEDTIPMCFLQKFNKL